MSVIHMPSSISTILQARIPNARAEEIRSLADEQGRTVSDLIRASLDASLRPIDAAHAESHRIRTFLGDVQR